MTTAPSPFTLHLAKLGIALALLAVPTAYATDWPQRRGPLQDGISKEKISVDSVKEKGFETLWRADVGTGVSSMAVVGDRVYTLGNKGNKDVVVAIDGKTGKKIWDFEYRCPLDLRMFSGGPAASPTVNDGMVYTLSHLGQLHALDAETGKLVWKTDLVKDHNGRRAQWGYSQSPIIVDDLLITIPGAKNGNALALDKKTGKKVWQSGDYGAGYATPLVFEHNGKPAVAAFTAKDLVAYDAKTGKELFSEPWETSYDVNAATPIFEDNMMFISSGYGSGSAAFKVSGNKTKRAWKNKDFQNQMTNSVLYDGVLYGFSMQHVNNPKNRSLKAVDFKTGKELWKETEVNMGALIVVDGKLVIADTSGEVILVEPSREGFKEIAREHLLGGTNWVTPAFSNGVLYVRNNEGKIVALKLG